MLAWLCFGVVMAQPSFGQYFGNPRHNFMLENDIWFYSAEPLIRQISRDNPIEALRGPVLVEFFAPWCPHCQHFRSHFIAAARQLQIDRPMLIVAGVDCEMNDDICNEYNVDGYPTVRLLNLRSGVATFKGPYHAKSLVEWVQARVQESGKASKLKRRSRASFATNRSSTAPAAVGGHTTTRSSVRHMTAKALLTDVVSAITFWLHHNIFIGTENLEGERLDALTRVVDAMHLFAAKVCAKNDEVTNVANALQFLHEYLISSETVSKSDWSTLLQRSGLTSTVTWSAQCRESSSPFTCGLWLLFHSMTAHARSVDAASKTCGAIVTFVEKFFGCDACRDHFLTMVPNNTNNLTHIEGVMWLWRTHNAVNLRLDANERTATDSSTKAQRPTPIECPDCTDGVGWNLNLVAKWLIDTYGSTCPK